MDPKDVVYLILAGMTVCGNLIAIVWFAASQKHKLGELQRGQERIYKILIPGDDGKLQFQSVQQCVDCRKNCKTEICEFVKNENAKTQKTLERMHLRIDELSEQLREINIWMPKEARKNDTR